MFESQKEDHLFYGSLSMTKDEIPDLESGKKILSELDHLMEKDEPLSSPLIGPDGTMKFFEQLFPELVESNCIGQLTKDSFRSWASGGNEVLVELDNKPSSNLQGAKDIYVGGPAALFSATIQAKSGEDVSDIVYCHDGNRGASNWKGSASYFHVRDAIPVYYWPDNHGAYTLYATMKHWIQRVCGYTGYYKEVAGDANWNKLRLNITGLMKEPLTFLLFAKNQIRALKDVGLHIEGTNLSASEKTTAYVTTNHAFLSHEILEKISPPRPMIVQNSEDKKALHLHVGGIDGLKEANGVFKRLISVCGDSVEHKKLTETELAERGYDTNFVKQALEFPNDGYIPPYVDGMLETMVRDVGGKVEDSLRLKKILVTHIGGDENDTRVSKVVFENVIDGSEKVIPVKSLYLSLGPSMRSMKVANPNNPGQLSGNLLQHIMWAAGSSIVFMVKIDKSLVDSASIAKFRDHIDAHNKHIVRLGEKEVDVDGKMFSLFCMQTTGGGAFPVKDAHAETAINVFKANVIPLLGLNQEGIEYDILSARSCARGITAQNTFRLMAPAANMAMIYGIGGIGMTTMAPNGLLLKAILGARHDLAYGKITDLEWRKCLEISKFNIPHWGHGNPFSRNYAQFTDSVGKPQIFAKYLQTQPRVIVPKIWPVMNRALRYISRA